MEIRNNRIESFLKSRSFSVCLALVWGTFSVRKGLTLANDFQLTDSIWLVYNVIVSWLFLIRERPSVVSMDVTHWSVALGTSFSGFLFSQNDSDVMPQIRVLGDGIICGAIIVGIASAVLLGRSYDVFPALRQVKTAGLYRLVRHPMYSSSIAIKLGYVLRHPSVFNACLFLGVALLYNLRATYEEHLMSSSELYRRYMQEVKYRFLPGTY